MVYRVLSLFAGIGGFDLGLERTGGFKTVAVAEVNPFACKVLAERFPDAVNVGDVTTAEYPDADFICAGFPCQDISFAGAGAGLAGARSGLWREVVRAIRVVRPGGVLLENVAALLSRGMGTVLGDLAEIGHDAEWHCIPAGAVGAPHVRDRIWILANPRDDGHGPVNGPRQDTGSSGRGEGEGHQRERLRAVFGGGRPIVADANGNWQPQPQGHEQDERRRAGDSGCSRNVSDAECIGRGQVVEPVFGRAPEQRPASALEYANQSRGWGWWKAEPDVGRVADGVPARVDRLKSLGNAVVPQIPELIGHAILSSKRIAA